MNAEAKAIQTMLAEESKASPVNAADWDVCETCHDSQRNENGLCDDCQWEASHG